MQRSTQSQSAPGPLRDVSRLNGAIVLVKSSGDHGNPPAAIRGTIEVRETVSGETEVSLAVDLPQMFRRRAHRRTLVLDPDAVRRLLESESNGTYEFTIDGDLE
jgi:hypothetical protein